MRGAFFFLVFMGLIASCSAGLKAGNDETIADGLVLVSAEFGLVEKAGDGAVHFTPADKVPLVAGKMYGWRLRLRTKRETVALREEFEMPVAPKTWGDPVEGGKFKVSADGRTGTTEADAVLAEGVIMNAWTIADGDPAGAHVIRLYLEGKLVRTFKFDVVAP